MQNALVHTRISVALDLYREVIDVFIMLFHYHVLDVKTNSTDYAVASKECYCTNFTM